MEQTTSTAGKGLGIAALVIGIICVIWSIIPILGAGAFWPSIIGLVLGTIGLIMAVRGLNPKKGIIITGFILCLIATGIATYWVVVLKDAVDAVNGINVQ
jgi:hypothetical protein